MSGSAIVSMILIVGVVVGGFVFFLIKALKNEKDK
ncbi:MetS family NSS transporter small subunit [Marinoscillum luteum]|jgi:LPS O-antigen subunit length determinant protein (WzzB/FepE family)|uniref:MetS family NSS transporter small subunit n=1 Tax=Marinoscillum luteum TaxID=861051 RepID=A0ABW7N7Z2_9BACT